MSAGDFVWTSGDCHAKKFWSLINRAKARAGEQVYARISTLADELKHLSNEDLVGFHRELLNAHLQAYRQDLWAAADVAMGDLGDDSFEYFRNWLISEGSETFTAVTTNPDELAKYNLRGTCGQLELFGYVASDLLMQRGIESDLPCTGEDLPGAPIEASEFSERFPRLTAKYVAGY